VNNLEFQTKYYIVITVRLDKLQQKQKKNVSGKWQISYFLETINGNKKIKSQGFEK
jgi:hypothetical protein